MNFKNIEITFSERCGYCVNVNGVPFLECLGEDEVAELTIKEINDLYNEVMLRV